MDWNCNSHSVCYIFEKDGLINETTIKYTKRDIAINIDSFYHSTVDSFCWDIFNLLSSFQSCHSDVSNICDFEDCDCVYYLLFTICNIFWNILREYFIIGFLMSRVPFIEFFVVIFLFFLYIAAFFARLFQEIYNEIDRIIQRY